MFVYCNIELCNSFVHSYVLDYTRIVSISDIIIQNSTQEKTESRDTPVPVPNWVTGYQSDRSPSPELVSLTSKYINSF